MRSRSFLEKYSVTITIQMRGASINGSLYCRLLTEAISTTAAKHTPPFHLLTWIMMMIMLMRITMVIKIRSTTC